MNALSRKFAAAASVAGLLALAACGSDGGKSIDSGSDNGGAAGNATGTIAGAGASAQESAQGAWFNGFMAQNPGSKVTYDSVGSGKGREQFLSGATDFAGTDDYLDEEELKASEKRCAGGTALDVPVYVSPIAVVYKLDGVEDLQLSPEVLAGIFSGTITKWNDPKIQADNPDAQLPDLTIVPVHRSDKSGTTGNFTDYLSQAAPNEWTHGHIDEWFESGGQSGDGTTGMMTAVTSGNGTIGYADASKAKGASVAKLKVGEEWVEVSPEGAAKAVEVSDVAEGRPEGDLALEIDRTTTESGAYPLVLVSYLAVCDTYDTAEKADTVKAYASYIISEQGQQDAAQAAGSAPLSEQMRKDAQASIDTIKAKG